MTEGNSAPEHVATIVREYGLSFVSGVEGANVTITDRQIIDVDGSNGIVRWVVVDWRKERVSKMTKISEFMKRHYSFRWFSDEWSIKQKWLYVALYVTLYNISLIPLLVLSEKTGLLVEGSSWSLGVLVILLLFWFAIYQPVVNSLVERVRRTRPTSDDL